MRLRFERNRVPHKGVNPRRIIARLDVRKAVGRAQNTLIRELDFLLVPAGHREQRFNIDLFKILRRIFRHVVREDIDKFLIERHLSFLNRESDRGRAEALTERIERVRNIGPVRRAPRFRDDLAVAQNHYRVDSSEFLVELTDRFGNYIGIEPDRFGRRARERPVFVEILRGGQTGREKRAQERRQRE